MKTWTIEISDEAAEVIAREAERQRRGSDDEIELLVERHAKQILEMERYEAQRIGSLASLAGPD